MKDVDKRKVESIGYKFFVRRFVILCIYFFLIYVFFYLMKIEKSGKVIIKNFGYRYVDFRSIYI